MSNEDNVIDLTSLKTPAPDVAGKDVLPEVVEGVERDLLADHAELKQKNAELLTRLSRFNIAPNPVLELKVRIDCLTQALMPDELKMAFECLYEQSYGELLEGILEELGGPRLLTPDQ